MVSSVTQNGKTTGYTYDANGNITEIKENGVVKESYTYDSLNQLKTVTRNNITTSYEYDNNGNITEVKQNGTTIKSYVYGDSEWKDLLTGFNGQSILYDVIGNPLTYRGKTMTWERGRRLAGITEGNNAIAYTYDDSGLRLSKTVNGQKTTYYVLNGELLGQQNPDGGTLQFLFDESGAKYGFIYNGATYYYNLNLQGDVTGIFDSTGADVVQYAYDEWGKLLSTTGTLASTIGQINPIRYRGYYYDSETGFYYLQSRYYDPETGRFINADGILGANGDILSYNLFAYCSNNPINHCDPTGKAIGQLWQIIKVAALVALGIITIQAIINTTTPQGNANMSRSLSQAASSAKDTLVRASTAFVKDYKVSKSNSRTKEKTVAKPAVPKKSNVIYRYGGTNPGNLTPSKRDVDLYPTTGKGLSFSTIPKPGAAMTTIEALNATGVVYAIQDGAGHVSVHPIGGTLEDWYNAGSSSVWTRAVKSVVVKWDGVN